VIGAFAKFGQALEDWGPMLDAPHRDIERALKTFGIVRGWGRNT
jgi:hypothetical protein